MNRFHPTSALADGPPPEVLGEIDVAWERAQALHTEGFAFPFEGLSPVEVVALACGETAEELLGAAPISRSHRTEPLGRVPSAG
ncbi:MAG: hypothetical protein M3P50_04820 [Actinomycetota bacterium]|nr:hypothetical protein [Actinomycetota bacterium]